MSDTLLETRGITVRFGGHTAVDDVSISVAAGTVTGLIGPNGAGKTTLFNTVTGLQKPTAGQVLLDGVDLTRAAPCKRARRGLARTSSCSCRCRCATTSGSPATCTAPRPVRGTTSTPRPTGCST